MSKVVYVLDHPRPHVYHTNMTCASLLRRGYVVGRLRRDGRVALGARGPVLRLTLCSRCGATEDAS